ncbi:filamentous hemagglutinin N-terminal domain-containing protein, partial [Fusobacterium polymorphum]|uniref:two-partner secretion domain-containing protein n=1 Tax=Fusobacterium nucleatum subsp. polymorphum TaxID=76857 RepID=UPI00300B7561
QGGREASTIINEVSGVNKSRIEGYQEIAGKKANYILANPNGIYINGAGFINTGNVTLTTGSGNNLLNPEKGTIEVAGKGLDLRNINKAELVARAAELSAPIYGGEELNLKLGSQGKSNKPEYALDARALGSIYAGRINIIVNEDGVGVKTQAPMYAEKGDVVISSKGKVYLKDTQAKGNINISST